MVLIVIAGELIVFDPPVPVFPPDEGEPPPPPPAVKTNYQMLCFHQLHRFQH